jgi:hypothetical protein
VNPLDGVAGRSFADIGAMWKVGGAVAIAAKRAGATQVTAVDLMPGTAELDQAGVRFVQGDLHDPATIERVGVHDVVWCSGVLYHAPHPLLTLERLRAITGERLVLATETLPLPGRLAAFAPPRWAHPGRPEPLDPATGYSGWWWLPTPAAVRAMLEASGFRVAGETRRRFHRTFLALRC